MSDVTLQGQREPHYRTERVKASEEACGRREGQPKIPIQAVSSADQRK